MSLSALFPSLVLAATFLIGLFYYQQIKTLPLRWLIVYLGFGVLVDIAFFIVPSRIQPFIGSLYCLTFPIEYWIYVNLFQIRQPSASRRFFRLTTIGLFLFGLSQLTFNNDQSAAASHVFKGMGILTLLLVLIYFWEIIQTNKVIALSRTPLFWLATGLLFFYCGNIIASGFYHALLIRSAEFAKNLYSSLNYTLNILRYIMYGVAFVIAANNRDE